MFGALEIMQESDPHNSYNSNEFPSADNYPSNVELTT
jgi:hypothetical protein